MISSGNDASEQAALKLTAQFVGALASGDVQQLAPLVADDIVFKDIVAGFPDLQGKEAFIKELTAFMSGPGKQISAAKQPIRAFALGGEEGTVVLNERVDSTIRDGRNVALPLAAVFWVRGGKIAAWYEFPLVQAAVPTRPA
jgi:limonene-1,2-epoxide hydrolase